MLDEVQPKITALELKQKKNKPKSSAAPFLIGLSVALAAFIGIQMFKKKQ